MVIGHMEVRVSLGGISGYFASYSDIGVGIEFKASPYYEIEEQLGSPAVCEGKPEASLSEN